MFRDVLVPLDGTPFAETALPLAARLARLGKARLHLLLVREPTMALVGMGELPRPAEEDSEAERDRTYLVDAATELRPSIGVPVGFHRVEGFPGPEICEEAGRLDADLLVMATHGRGTLRRLWLGGVADYVVRHLTAPILLVPPGSVIPNGDGRGCGILVALDLSKDAEAILEPVIALAQLADAHVTLMHVVEMSFEASRPQAQRQIDRLADRLRERGLSVSARVVTGLNPAGSLLDALGENRYGFLALTTHGRGGLRRLLLGSVADKVIRSVSKPVLIFRPPPATPTA